MQHAPQNSTLFVGKRNAAMDGIEHVYVRPRTVSEVAPQVVDLREASIDGVKRLAQHREPVTASHKALLEKKLQSLEDSLRPVRKPLDVLAQNARFDGIITASVRATVLFIVFTVNWFGLSAVGATFSYYSDTEAAVGTFESGLLDLVTVHTGETDKSLQCGGLLDFNFSVESEEGALPTNYGIHTQYVGTTDDEELLCNNLVALLRHDGMTYYDGPLLGLITEPIDTYGDWRLIVELDNDTLPTDFEATCPFYLVFDAWVEGAPRLATGGFNDVEALLFSVTKDAGCATGNCSDVEITVENDNDSTITNDFDFNLNTGGNSADGGGSNETGDVEVELDVENETNTNETDIDVSCCCGCSSCDSCDNGCDDEENSCGEDDSNDEEEGEEDTEEGDVDEDKEGDDELTNELVLEIGNDSSNEVVNEEEEEEDEGADDEDALSDYEVQREEARERISERLRHRDR